MVVDAGRITWVGPVSSLKAPAGADVVDLTGRYVMPGIIDLHGHFGITKDMTLDAKQYSRQTVEHDLKTYASYGVTTVQSLGLDSDLIFTVPEQTANRLVPGSPLAKMVVPAGTNLVCAYAAKRSMTCDPKPSNSG